MFKKIGKLAAAGALTVTLFSGLGVGQANANSLTPTEVKVNYEKGYSQADKAERQQPYVDLGNKKGTLVFKMYPNTKKGIWATNIWLEAKNNFGGHYALMDGPSVLKQGTTGLYGFNLIKNAKGEKHVWKYEAGITGGGTAPNGRNYIALAVYLPKPLNGGRYYLDHSSMSEGSWEIKAYFYENIDLEDSLFFQIDKLFPLVGKVMWGKTEVKPGQIGKLTIKAPTTLWKETNGVLEKSRTLNVGEEYRIYGYKEQDGGIYGVGGGYYVKKDSSKALYETPSKAKLRLAEILYKE
ncbi:hypothetical protein LIS82_26735 (plasmid) [Cytobacillus solani]|uniref:hypothetical protein n=1 Tax=Cytobacillus solani TaxID=1637975 RepID=UPI002079FA94|nr:hypothetical protein [Cytobacillus solani]USK57820.1 hypothetical protein LIS82_26735 [Cytobacillus solani]